ncbi:hypothetical protein E2C01_000404 [Portunus trituberculatus]|uniref:Uncharacterized protein n=1 Tax=Portunus trituberculatus TaxID=210409 RepID=A0A5B7CEK8_PORTR|nr:hypothetical protein [Portunus trituberculatus]
MGVWTQPTMIIKAGRPRSPSHPTCEASQLDGKLPLERYTGGRPLRGVATWENLRRGAPYGSFQVSLSGKRTRRLLFLVHTRPHVTARLPRPSRLSQVMIFSVQPRSFLSTAARSLI